MAYSDFTLDDLRKKFGLHFRRAKIFSALVPREPSLRLRQELDIALSLPLGSEKARSERLISPILLELFETNNRKFAIYSGENLTANKETGLSGECDFILGANPNAPYIEAPILAIAEAKKQDFDAGVAQCAAQLMGAKIWNENENQPANVLHGIVTTGTDWQFLLLNLENEIVIHPDYFELKNLPELLGALQAVIDFYFPKQ